jgi:hypothetical protein
MAKRRNHPISIAKAEANFKEIRDIRERYSLSLNEVAKLCGYSMDSARGWFSNKGSARYRLVPDRAVTIARMRLTTASEETLSKELA